MITDYPDFKGSGDDASQEKSVAKSGRSGNAIRKSIKGISGMKIIIPYDEFIKIDKDTLYNTTMFSKRNWRLTTGVLTVPFKLRPAIEDKNFTMSTDATIGPYLGVTKRINKRNPYYLTIPATLGLTFVNINDNTTSNVESDPNIGVVPAITWSTGLILQLNKFDVGFVLGQDFASDVGDQWIYQGKLWYSFAIGYSFSKPE